MGKSAEDLQSDVEVGDDAITGTLNYVTDYTGYSGSAELQSGNYLALHATAEAGATITVELLGGTTGPVTLDTDGISIGRITSTEQSVQFVATKNGMTQTRTFALSGLTLSPEG